METILPILGIFFVVGTLTMFAVHELQIRALEYELAVREEHLRLLIANAHERITVIKDYIAQRQAIELIEEHRETAH